MSDAARLKNTIYVGGLDNTITRDLLQQAFLPFGEITDIQIPDQNPPSSNFSATGHNSTATSNRGFALIEYESPIDATAAIDNMDQSMLAGRVLKVAQAKPQKDVNEGLGSKTAVWEQEGWLAKYQVSEEDKTAALKAQEELSRRKVGETDVMLGLEGNVQAGPKKPEGL